ncbi:hypothetical protein [Micromonospora zhanjiangensis]
MTDLVDAVRLLTKEPSLGPALIVRTPEGTYLISPDGSGGNARNHYVISRGQLGLLMWEHNELSDDLADPERAARVAALVAAFRPPGCREPGDG